MFVGAPLPKCKDNGAREVTFEHRRPQKHYVHKIPSNMFRGIKSWAVMHYIAGKIVLAHCLCSEMHILCIAAFRSITLYWFLLRIATGPEFGYALHYRKKVWGINYGL